MKIFAISQKKSIFQHGTPTPNSVEGRDLLAPTSSAPGRSQNKTMKFCQYQAALFHGSENFTDSSSTLDFFGK